MPAPARANGFQATTGFADDPTLNDGNDVPSTANSGAGTGYARTVTGNGAVSAITVMLYLGETPPAIYDVDLIFGYRSTPAVALDGSNDGFRWTTVSTTLGAIEEGETCTLLELFHLFALSPPTAYKYLRFSLSDTDTNGCGEATAAVYEIWATNSVGGVIPIQDYMTSPSVTGSGPMGGTPSMGAVYDPGSTIWTVGFVFGTMPGGVASGIPYGEMSDYQLKDSIALKEVMGSSRLGAVAVGIQNRKVTGSVKWLKVRANNFLQFRGGSVTYSAGVTTYAAGVADEPTPSNMQFMSPADGSTAELICLGCIAPDLTLPLQNRDFAIPDVAFNIYGDSTNFYQLLLPGNQTVS